MDEVEQDGKGQRQTQSGERGGEQRREHDRRVNEAGAEWAGRVPLARKEGITLKWPNPLSREYLALGILSTFPSSPTRLLLLSFIPELPRTQGHIPPPGILECAHHELEGCHPLSCAREAMCWGG